MQGYVSLSRKEKYQHFFYLLLLLAAAVIILGFIFFRKYQSPFSNEALYEMQLLEEKNKFTKLQEEKSLLLLNQQTELRIRILLI